MRSLVLGVWGGRGRARRSLALLGVIGLSLLAALPAAAAAGAHASALPLTAAGPAATTSPPSNASDEGWYHLNVHSVSPGAVDSAAATFDGKDGYVLLFGGCSKPVCPLGYTWKFQANGWANLTGSVGYPPSARYAAGMTYDARDGYVVLFGGMGATGALGDTWTFQYGRWTQVTTSGASAPPARSGAGLIYDALDSDVILFGGASATGAPLADTWSFAGGVWTNLTASAVSAPPARFSAGFAYDSLDRMGLLFGGTGLCGAYCGDTWGFAGGHWMNLTSAVGGSVPSPRSEAALTYDAGRNAVVLIGGENGVILSDTWGFAHGAWLYLSANSSASLGSRANLAAAFDPGDGYLVAYGGHNSAGLRLGTWILLTPLAVTVAASLPSVTTGQAEQFTASTSGGFGPVNVSWNFGDGTATAIGASVGHTYFSAGSFQVTTTATDSLQVT
ncbi:MAG: PKD domain-containing protein, partial [Thermoplasmata archaeon]|nr:PKD domain-containing protein [Thermoplasmata archaeon]